MSLTPSFYSVQICNNCQKRELEKWVAADGREFHGILGCKNCHMLWNRDVNAAKNMYWIAESIWAGHGRSSMLPKAILQYHRCERGSHGSGLRFLHLW